MGQISEKYVTYAYKGHCRQDNIIYNGTKLHDHSSSMPYFWTFGGMRISPNIFQKKIVLMGTFT